MPQIFSLLSCNDRPRRAPEPVRLIPVNRLRASRRKTLLLIYEPLRPSRAESKFCTPNGGACISKTIGLLVRRHIVAGDFHYIGKEASTRWAGGVDLSMMAEAGALDPIDETFREYERVVDPKYLEEIRVAAKQFSTKRLSRQSGVAKCAIRNFKNGKDTIKPRTLRKLTRAIHDLQNRNMKNYESEG